MRKHLLITIICLFAFVFASSAIFPSPAHAEKIPALSEIPANLPDNSRRQLETRRQELENELANFLAAAEAFNAKEAEHQSDAEYNALNGKRDAYINAAKAFNSEVMLAKILDDGDKRALPVDPPRTNDKTKRSAYEYHMVIEQFKLTYKPRRYDVEFYEEKGVKKKKTFCNILVWDVTRAMVGPDEEIPHWVNGKEMTVNDLVGWLRKEGKARGWRRLDDRGAQQAANDGHPTIAIWKNVGGSGHVAIVRPGSVGGDRWNDRRSAIAQAGRLVLDATHLTKGFNDPKLRKEIEFWTHE